MYDLDSMRNCIFIASSNFFVHNWDISITIPSFCSSGIELSHWVVRLWICLLTKSDRYRRSSFLKCQFHFFFIFQINIDYQMREATAKRAQDPTRTSFDEAQKMVYILMERDSYPRFLKSKAYLNLLNQLQTSTSSWSVWGNGESRRLCQISCGKILQGGWISARRTSAKGGRVQVRCKQLHSQESTE